MKKEIFNYLIEKMIELDNEYKQQLKKRKSRIDENTFSDSIAELNQLEKAILKEMSTVLTLTPKLKLVPPNTIERFEGKGKRLIDRRKI